MQTLLNKGRQLHTTRHVNQTTLAENVTTGVTIPCPDFSARRSVSLVINAPSAATANVSLQSLFGANWCEVGAQAVSAAGTTVLKFENAAFFGEQTRVVVTISAGSLNLYGCYLDAP